jgi:hypothetical protein
MNPYGGNDDSDSDDDPLLSTSTFRKRSSNRETNWQKQKHTDLLKQGLESAERHNDCRIRIQQLKLGSTRTGSEEGKDDGDDDDDDDDDDDLHRKIMAISASVEGRTRPPRFGDDNADSCDDKDDRFDNCVPKELRVALRRALDGDRTSSPLGTRPNRIGFRPTPSVLLPLPSTATAASHSGAATAIPPPPRFYTDCEGAVADLKRVLLASTRSGSSSPHTTTNNSNNADDEDASKKVLCAIDAQAPYMLIEVLRSRPDLTVWGEGRVQQWLLSVAYSAGLGRGDGSLSLLADAACKVLLRRQITEPDAFVMSSAEFVHLIGHWSGDVHSDGNAAWEGSEAAVKNLAGLNAVLTLWGTKFHKTSTNDKVDNTIGSCYVALGSLALDDWIDIHTTTLLQHTFVHLGTVTTTSDEEFLAISRSIVECLAQWGPGPRGMEDASDAKAWLSQSAVARLIPNQCSRLKAIFAMHVMERCLSDMHGHETDLINAILSALAAAEHTQLAETAQNLLSWKAIASLYAVVEALIVVDIAVIASDPCRCLAVIEASFCAYQAGLLLLDSDSCAGAAEEEKFSEYGSNDNAKLIFEFLHMLKRPLETLASRMTGFATNGIVQRTDTVIMMFQQHNLAVQDRAKLLTKMIPAGPPKQKKLSSFFQKAYS